MLLKAGEIHRLLQLSCIAYTSNVADASNVANVTHIPDSVGVSIVVTDIYIDICII